MLPQEVIRRKRDGHPLKKMEVRDFIRGLTDGTVSEGQVAAFAMAVYFKGMSSEEAVGLTLAMRDSGEVLSWNLPGPVADKHSSGGIGDNVSLMLAPMLAACGLFVPMISGRGLGHTGGTLDKLDSIPGYQSQPKLDLFKKTVREAGCAIIGQTADLAPADKRLYGIRDVTATVESVPLITASILSKKLASGLQHLVLDVKCGSGAFMATIEQARELAESLVSVANGAGLKTSALITDMDEPLASCAGNAIEVQSAVDYLTGKHRDARLHDVVMALGEELLVSAGISNAERARELLETCLADGTATERFQTMVTLLGGPKDFAQSPEKHLKQANITKSVYDEGDGGIVQSIDTRFLGMAVVELGGGRRIATDDINHAVGLTQLAGKGDTVGSKKPLAIVHAMSEAALERASTIVRSAYRLGQKANRGPTIIEHVGPH
jgi:thymidine phosphorylase